LVADSVVVVQLAVAAPADGDFELAVGLQIRLRESEGAMPSGLPSL
jgi:hypothetical protein